MAETITSMWASQMCSPRRDDGKPEELVEWVVNRRDTDFGIARMNAASLVRFRFCAADGRPRMRPELLGSAMLSGST